MLGMKKKKKKTKADTLLDIVEEMQKNLDFLNDRVQRMLDRMGME
jgi:hypothetical protein